MGNWINYLLHHYSKFVLHRDNCKMHQHASLDLIDFMKNMESNEAAVNVRLNKIVNDRITKNREKLKAIIDCVVVLG